MTVNIAEIGKDKNADATHTRAISSSSSLYTNVPVRVK